MTTTLVIMVGSRGDTEPFLALTAAILSTAASSHVHLLIQPDYTHLVPSHPRITVHLLPFSLATFGAVYFPEFVKFKLRSFFTGELFDIVSFQRNCISLMVSRFILPALPHVHKIAVDASPSLIVSSSLAGTLTATLADLLGIPGAVINLQPNVPTGAYPNYVSSISGAKLAASEIAALINHPSRPHKDDPTYRATFDNEFHKASFTVLNGLRIKYGLPQITEEQMDALLLGGYPGVHIVNAYPEQLIPSGQDWSTQVHQVPALADEYLPPDWDPQEKCPNLTKYLQQGPKPTVVSFGSMETQAYTTAVSRAVLQGLRDAGVERAIILKGRSDIGAHQLLGGEDKPQSFCSKMFSCAANLIRRGLHLFGLGRAFGLADDEAVRMADMDLREWASSHVLHCSESPQYAWLLPKCDGLICHGGAGTLMAGLRAGLPVVVSPILCDQFFWGQLVEELGIGAIAGPMLTEADSKAFEKAVKVVRGEKVRNQAKQFGETIRKQGNGSEVTAKMLTSLVSPTEMLGSVYRT